MRIDFIITELFVGGAEKCLTEIALAMHQGGDKVRVFSIGSLPTGNQRQLVARLEDAGINVQSANCDSPRNALSAYRFLKRHLIDDPPDVVQTFLHHANILGVHAARSAGVPKCVAAIRVAQNQRFRNHLERLSLKRVDQTLCVSRAVERFAREILRCPSDTTSVIPNGVDLERFTEVTPRRWESIGWPPDARVMLFIGRLDPQKGIDLLEQQVDRLAPPNSKRKLLLIGDGPLRDRINQWVNEIGKDRVQCLPWQPKVAPWIQASELMILPSRYEGMPNVLLEAMACAKPVVCSQVEGSEELLDTTIAIQGFRSGQGEEMANRVCHLMEQPDLGRQLGLENRDRISESYSLTNMIDRYRDFYRSLFT